MPTQSGRAPSQSPRNPLLSRPRLRSWSHLLLYLGHLDLHPDPCNLVMKDYGWLPPITKRNRYRLVRRRTLLTLAFMATLATGAVVVQQWVWSGQRPHKTLPFEEALKIAKDQKEIEVKRNTAALYLQQRVFLAIDAMKAFEKEAGPEFKAGIQNALRRIEGRARAKK